MLHIKLRWSNEFVFGILEIQLKCFILFQCVFKESSSIIIFFNKTKIDKQIIMQINIYTLEIVGWGERGARGGRRRASSGTEPNFCKHTLF